MSKSLKKLYKESARHWYNQIALAKIKRYMNLGRCSFCYDACSKKGHRECESCRIDKTLCGNKDSLYLKVSYSEFVDDRIRLGEELRKELKKRAK